jgi:hypothetical protein
MLILRGVHSSVSDEYYVPSKRRESVTVLRGVTSRGARTQNTISVETSNLPALHLGLFFITKL